ncbi:alanine--tRNA ligase [bacterium]|nr:alanine--tRNA ligase [bacterium]NBX71804.1 alanine--tRNA ligase [bacterium]
MSYNDIRRSFIEYFQRNQHVIKPSSSLVPAEDPTLLFANAGMNQFKDIFLGIEQAESPSVVTVQRCVRAGGKHNDLENVGYTARHHTFFEMLGNFSFGSYFKREAISLAFNFITKEVNIPVDRLWVTVHYSDDEAYDIWHHEMNMPCDRIVRCSDKDNFWAMGDVGPCGPCSEIFYDHGPSVAGGPPGSDNADGDRFMEIWNLVFMQYHRQADGQQIILPKPCVDTGMGLERLACVLEGVISNFDTSLFKSLKKDLMNSVSNGQTDDASLNVLADHLRSSAFIIADGITPSAEGRGYVLRRLIRRALRHGYKMGIKKPFLHKHVHHLINLMQDAYPYLKAQQKLCEKVLLQEQELFFETLQSGMKYFAQSLDQTKDSITGETLFKLYDTYGFPIDIALDEAKERGLRCDTEAFEALMEERKVQSRQSQQHALQADITQLPIEPSEFLRSTLETQAKITAILPVAGAPHLSWVCLNHTPFYAESGGQVGDTGLLKTATTLLNVLDTQKIYHQIAMLVECEQSQLKVGEEVEAKVDAARRIAIERHHTATHLLHAALRELLGSSVQQKGSLVTPERLRFDFAFERALTEDEITALETYCQQHIQSNRFVSTAILTKEQALQEGALAFFEDKYGQTVRVLTIGDGFSKELCGGTHIESLGELMAMVIIVEESVAAGIRRIQALAGQAALDYLKHQRSTSLRLAEILNVKTPELVSSVLKLQETIKTQQMMLQKLAQKNLTLTLAQTPLIKIKDYDFLVQEIDSSHADLLKTAADIVRSRSTDIVGLLICLNNEKLSVILTASPGLADKVKLKNIFDQIKGEFDLKGGGRPDMIQAGSTTGSSAKLKKLIQQVTALLMA